jgi:hypothetical protein
MNHEADLELISAKSPVIVQQVLEKSEGCRTESGGERPNTRPVACECTDCNADEKTRSRVHAYGRDRRLEDLAAKLHGSGDRPPQVVSIGQLESPQCRVWSSLPEECRYIGQPLESKPRVCGCMKAEIQQEFVGRERWKRAVGQHGHILNIRLA